MRRAWHWRTFLAGIALGMVLVPASRAYAQSIVVVPDASGAEQNSAEPPKTVKVSGMVVNSATGAGVTKALVQFNGWSHQPVFTGPDGRFDVELPEGQCVFNVRKPGYFDEQELDNGQSGGILPTKVEPNMPALRLTLTPEASLEGHVTDSAGEPIEGAAIELLSVSFQQGRKTWVQAGGGQTDDGGEYSITGLRPGDYLVKFTAFDYSAVRPVGKTSDKIYPPQFYPGVPSRDQAPELHVSPGQALQLDMSLKKSEGYRISGVVSGTAAGNLQLIAADDRSVVEQTGTGMQGEFEFKGVSPGAYTLRASIWGAEPMFGELAVAVERSDVKNAVVSLQPALRIPIQLSVTQTRPADSGNNLTESFGLASENGGQALQAPQGVQMGFLSLGPDEPGQPTYSPPVALMANGGAGGSLELTSVLPGSYRVQINLNGAYYVESARAAGVDLLTSPLIVSSTGGAPPIRVSIRDDGASLNIKVSPQPAEKMVALLVVPVAGGEPKMVFSAGIYRTGGLAPGDYRVYAWDTVAGLEYANPEALREFLGKSQAITLSPNQSAEITVSVIHRGAP